MAAVALPEHSQAVVVVLDALVFVTRGGRAKRAMDRRRQCRAHSVGDGGCKRAVAGAAEVCAGGEASKDGAEIGRNERGGGRVVRAFGCGDLWGDLAKPRFGPASEPALGGEDYRDAQEAPLSTCWGHVVLLDMATCLNTPPESG